jgi:adenylate kinase family enzyme
VDRPLSAPQQYRAVSGTIQGPKAPLDARPTRRTPGNAPRPYSHLRDTEVMSDAALTIGRRVIVTGLAGSGKSTFSLALGAKTGLPVIHLDLHFWRPGWVAPSKEEWRDKQRVLLASDAWIADGNYHETLDLRLARADTVVFLDIPWWVCARRGFVRGVRKRPADCQLPEGCDESAWRRLRTEWRVAGRTGENAAHNPSASTRSFPSTRSTRPFTCSRPHGELRSSSTDWPCPCETIRDVPSSYNRKLWIHDRMKGATYPPS